MLFDTHTDAMAALTLFRQAGIQARVSPTPHGTNLRPGCGVALLLDPADMQRAQETVKTNGACVAGIVCLPSRINPRRDQFC